MVTVLTINMVAVRLAKVNQSDRRRICNAELLAALTSQFKTLYNAVMVTVLTINMLGSKDGKRKPKQKEEVDVLQKFPLKSY